MQSKDKSNKNTPTLQLTTTPSNELAGNNLAAMPRGGRGGGEGPNKIPACPPRFLRFTTTPSNELAGKSQQPGLIRSPSHCILKPEILGTIIHKVLLQNYFSFQKEYIN